MEYFYFPLIISCTSLTPTIYFKQLSVNCLLFFIISFTFCKDSYPAARDYLNIIKVEKGLDWTYFNPALETHPGITTGRTGKYRLGTDYPAFNEEGRSILSAEDVAVVIADEIEAPRHQKKRFTASY